MSQAATRVRDRIVGAALLLVSALVVAASWRLPETAAADAMGPKAYPMALALVLALLSLALMRGGGKGAGATLTRDMVVFGFLPILAMLALYVLLVPVLGFVICTVALLLACFRLKGERNWKVNVAVAVGSSLAIWALFAWLLNVQLRLLPSLA
ncbi:MAG: tripartite tricarboxylate transporter TctB family protein [Deltaproteobacteria bacterium]|nr:tripartite tricarboxylate transporter TctB family protein [Deltaproteobacteria bacterium]